MSDIQNTRVTYDNILTYNYIEVTTNWETPVLISLEYAKSCDDFIGMVWCTLNLNISYVVFLFLIF
jgi:hypothetical protein